MQKWRKRDSQKQPPELKYKKSCSQKFRNILRKAIVLESFFIEKETLAQVFSCEFCEIYKNTFFTEQLRTKKHIKL